MFEHLPGGEFIDPGLRDLQGGKLSAEALLLLIARPRLLKHGIPVPAISNLPACAEELLYDLLVEQHGPAAYMRYNALLARVVGFENALDAMCSGSA